MTMAALTIAVASLAQTSVGVAERNGGATLSPVRIVELDRVLRGLDRPDVASDLVRHGSKLRATHVGGRAALFGYGTQKGSIEPAYEFVFDYEYAPRVVLRSFSFENEPTSSEPNFLESQLESKARLYVGRISGATTLKRLSGAEEWVPDEPRENALSFSYVQTFAGLRTPRSYSISFDRGTGRVLRVLLPEAVDVETRGADAHLDEETLRGRALSFFADERPFEQGEISLSTLTLDVPLPYGQGWNHARPEGRLATALHGPDRNAFFRRLAAERLAIPLYRLEIERSPSRTWIVSLDARDGSLVGTGVKNALAGSTAKKAGSGKVSFPSLKPLGRTATNPAGRSVYVQEDSTVRLARFDVGQGQVWMRSSDQDAYRAFRPDAGLRRALQKQARAQGGSGER